MLSLGGDVIILKLFQPSNVLSIEISLLICDPNWSMNIFSSVTQKAALGLICINLNGFTSRRTIRINPLPTGTGWVLYKVYGDLQNLVVNGSIQECVN